MHEHHKLVSELAQWCLTMAFLSENDYKGPYTPNPPTTSVDLVSASLTSALNSLLHSELRNSHCSCCRLTQPESPQMLLFKFPFQQNSCTSNKSWLDQRLTTSFCVTVYYYHSGTRHNIVKTAPTLDRRTTPPNLSLRAVSFRALQRATRGFAHNPIIY